MTKGEHVEEYERSLSVHHIIKRQAFESEERANHLSNLVTVCRECHGAVEGLTPYELFVETFGGDGKKEVFSMDRTTD